MLHDKVWEKFNGPIPEGKIIDHKNGKTFDCLPDNLRASTYSENNHNRNYEKPVNRGYPRGVSPDDNGFRARMTFQTKRVLNKLFKTVEEASQAYEEARNIYYKDILQNEN